MKVTRYVVDNDQMSTAYRNIEAQAIEQVDKAPDLFQRDNLIMRDVLVDILMESCLESYNCKRHVIETVCEDASYFSKELRVSLTFDSEEDLVHFTLTNL